jgi:two-component system, NarL family, nitrate/nitrite response regulator NarL
MRILIVERHALLRAGIAELIKTGKPDWEIASAGSLVEARELLGTGCFTVCLIGDELLQSRDLHELVTLREGFPALKLIVRSGDPHRDVILACFRVGAHGCVTGSTSAADLLQAISRVASGAVEVPASLVDLAGPASRRRQGDPGGPLSVRLTGRQSDVLGLLGEGRSTKEIARSLDLSVGTIKVHLASLFRALGARNRVEAAIKATEYHFDSQSLKHAG